MAAHGSAKLLKPITISDQSDSADEFEQDEVNADKLRVEYLTEIVCAAGGEAAAALLVLMAMLENSIEPNALANAAKHSAFTHCGELNLYGMVDAQVAIVEGKLFPVH